MSDRTLVNLLHNRASQQPDQTAYTFLVDGENESGNLTYRSLDEKARAIAVYLQSRLSPGERVLLVYPQGLEAIAAFFGCLYAGVVAIPAPAPEAARMKRVLPRLEAIASDAGASLILTSASLLANSDGNHLTFKAKSSVSRLNGRASLLLNYYLVGGAIAQKTPQIATIPWIATEKIPSQLAAQWQQPEINGDTLAYLQYTSGSTSTPKGVMLDHKNLMGHLAELQQACGYKADLTPLPYKGMGETISPLLQGEGLGERLTENYCDSHSVTVTWMPYFHDYGLVEGILAPLYNGTPCYLMSPMAFIKQPLRWLKAISHYRATHSQAPNFAYAYCLKRITSEERATLDLSCWQAAGNAAEPINPEVIEQFCQTFEPCGFRRQTFAPGYGLAEATLVVTTSRKTDNPVFCTVSAEELAQNRLVLTPTGQRLAGSGRLLENTVVAIVHPEKLTRCASDEVGEIWVASAGVAQGYWQRPDATQETFGASIADTGEGAFLRTGDLGFIQDGELFVRGRLKDLIIIRGENYYPQDIEWVVEKSHGALRPNYGAAFAIEVDGVEQLVIAFEVERGLSKNLNVDEVVGAIRNAVAEHYELPVYGVVLLKRGSILKTSSGKIQRQACRKAFVDGSLDSIAIWTLESASSQLESVPQNDVEFQLVQIWQKVLGISPISTKDNFFELGGDSLKTAVVVAELEEIFSQAIPSAILAEAPTIEQLANLFVQKYWKKIGSRSLVSIKPSGCKRPFFYVHGISGFGFAPTLARYLHPERPLYGLQAVGLDGEAAPYTRIEDVVMYYIQEIQTVQPEGSYLLGGQCSGGNIAFAMAQELKKRGQQVLLVVMSDSHNPFIEEEQRVEWLHHWRSFGKQGDREKLISSGFSLRQVDNTLKVIEANHQILVNHQPQRYSGRVVYFSAQENQEYLKEYANHFDPMQPNGWNNWVDGGIEVIGVPGRHGTYHNEPHVRVLAEKLNACLEEVDSVLLSERR
ncbi:AMP-binding protein [Nostoc sp. JL23]|uniref:AMP-binding protein n=1 Tax=Nostoc sp. JL23 TaxID=2815394 RepID=UPI001D28D8EE|nr:AMP-binding protein [Nostoc sp. JL23]MBN3879926.1 AMP-binding protein [Nostoc sp. JL23]